VKECIRGGGRHLQDVKVIVADMYDAKTNITGRNCEKMCT
jgi:hypothetical protein